LSHNLLLIIVIAVGSPSNSSDDESDDSYNKLWINSAKMNGTVDDEGEINEKSMASISTLCLQDK
jgi:hypothetical protein